MNKAYAYIHLALFSFSLFFNSHLSAFTNLAQTQAYAAQHEEYPQPDNNNLLTPDYKSHYQSLNPTWIKRLGQFFGLIQKPLWKAEQLKELLEAITDWRQTNGYNGRFVEKMYPKPGSQFILFGDLHGAFHSLVRDLQKLVLMGIMNEDFKITQKDTYLIFSGDTIDLSPYILETLTLVLTLMQKNPRTIIYTRGKHEDKEYWLNFGLKQELEIRAQGISSEKTPLKSTVNKFFATLPLAFYLVSENKKTLNIVRISWQGRKDTELREEEFGDFFTEQNKNPDIFNLNNKVPSNLSLDMKAIIKSDERSSTYTPSKGLLNVEPDEGATAWTLLSSPIRTNRTLYEFFYDAFASLVTASDIDNWTLSLYNRDVRDIHDISKTITYNLVTGQEIRPHSEVSTQEKKTEQLQKEINDLQQEKVELNKQLEECKKGNLVAATSTQEPALQTVSLTSTITQPQESTNQTEGEFVIGTLQDLSKYLKVESNYTQEGLQLAINRANESGGIRGKKIKLIVLDDEYNPELARKNVEILLTKYNASIILCPMGSPPLSGYLDMVKEKKVLVLFPSTGSSAIHDPQYRNIIHYRASYGIINATLLHYAKKEFSAQKFAIFYPQDISAVGIEDQLKDAGILDKDRILAPYEPSERSFTKQAEIIKNFNPNVLAFLGTARATETLISDIGVENLIDKHLLGTELGDVVFKAFLQEHGLTTRYLDSQNIPNPKTSMLEIMQEYRQEIRDKTIDVFSAEAYIVASIFIDVLKRIDGDITNEKIVETMEKTKQYNFKGLTLDFNPAARRLSNFIWLDNGKPEWTKIELQFDQRTYGAQKSKYETRP